MNDKRNMVEKRASERKEVKQSTSILLEGKVIDGQVIDISAHGAKVHTENPIEPKSQVVLSIARFGDYKGEIVWCRNSDVGLKFTDDPAVIAELAYAMAIYGS